MKRPTPRHFAPLLILQMLLTACSATAQPFARTGSTWPEPQPQPPSQINSPNAPQNWPQPTPIVRTAPNFLAPSATHCARPVSMREVPGRGGEQATFHGSKRRDDELGRLAKSAPSKEESAVASAAPSLRAEAAGSSTGAIADTRARPPAPASAAPQFAPPRSYPQTSQQTSPQPPSPPPQQPPQDSHRTGPVTAGMVDDNADFTSYLAFRNRTRVAHRARDIRERYLLEVKDPSGRGIADAEVAVQAASGYAMWARTDTAGRVWLHPNAFDPSRSAQYDIAVRKDGRIGHTQLVRGQKSSAEVVVAAQAAPSRARLDLVFLIDATGSMADEIDKLKSSLRSISADVARLPSQPDLCFGLVAYRDKSDAFLTRTHDLTNDLDQFLSGALMPLQAAGGGDYPEAMNEAFHESVHNISWRGDGATRMVILLADAPPHLDYGGPQYDDDMIAALGKGIKVFSVGASGLDKQGEFIQRQIAQYTGGRFVFLTYDNAHDLASGPGRETVHDVKNYSVDTLDRLVVRLVSEELGKLAR